MLNALAQEDIDIFSSDPAGVKEQPGSPYYADGVEVGYTAPAKWWNWLWNVITTFFTGSKADRQNILTELKNVLSAASISPDSSDAYQLHRATGIISYNAVSTYDQAEITETIGGVPVTHKVNQPYVIGNTLYLPDTELL